MVVGSYKERAELDSGTDHVWTWAIPEVFRAYPLLCIQWLFPEGLRRPYGESGIELGWLSVRHTPNPLYYSVSPTCSLDLGIDSLMIPECWDSNMIAFECSEHLLGNSEDDEERSYLDVNSGLVWEAMLSLDSTEVTGWILGIQVSGA